jgi:hypothetical protein
LRILREKGDFENIPPIYAQNRVGLAKEYNQKGRFFWVESKKKQAGLSCSVQISRRIFNGFSTKSFCCHGEPLYVCRDYLSCQKGETEGRIFMAMAIDRRRHSDACALV